jgi:hypothetical protein
MVIGGKQGANKVIRAEFVVVNAILAGFCRVPKTLFLWGGYRG